MYEMICGTDTIVSDVVFSKIYINLTFDLRLLKSPANK
jgi:hypothetical protein